MDLDPTACLFVGQELKGEKTGNYKEQDPPPTRQWGSIRRKVLELHRRLGLVDTLEEEE
jgi:hypothetical protein